MESKSWPFKPFGFTKPDTHSSRLCVFVLGACDPPLRPTGISLNRVSEPGDDVKIPWAVHHFTQTSSCVVHLGCAYLLPQDSQAKHPAANRQHGGRGGGGNNAINNNKDFVNDSTSPPPLPWSSLQQHDSTPRTPSSASMSHQPPYFLGGAVLGSRPSCACAWIRLVHSAMSKLPCPNTTNRKIQQRSPRRCSPSNFDSGNDLPTTGTR
jgi:hypothetical protein